MYRVGHVFDKMTEQSFELQTDAWKRDADCGCGIDCCEGKLKLPDTTVVATMSLYFADGGMMVKNETTGDVYTVTLTPVA